MEYLFDALIDTLKLVPYLFLTFLFLEYIEHKFSKKAQQVLMKYRGIGPVVGGIFGGFPQCGFSAMAANLYTARVITIGTVVAVFLSTSDEMLPIMLGEGVAFEQVAKIIGFKILVGVAVGLIVDVIFRKEVKKNNAIKEICHSEHCDCEEKGVFVSSLKHTFRTLIFVLVVNFVINFVIGLIGEDKITAVLGGRNVWVYFVASLIGLIPNCAGSIVLTEAYLANFISIGAAMAGLLTGSGLGILLLFKQNKSLKENLIILFAVYFVGVLIGAMVDLTGWLT